MIDLRFNIFLWISLLMTQILPDSIATGHSWCPSPPNQRPNPKFEQKTSRFWEFEEESNRWVEINLPFYLMSCINESCTKVGSIDRAKKEHDRFSSSKQGVSTKYEDEENEVAEESSQIVLPIRRRVSLAKMSEASIWVTGQSGSIYERFWNGVQWVIAPHELPAWAGHAISVFVVNQTIFALSEAGILYQLQLNENSEPIWMKFIVIFEGSMPSGDTEPSLTDQIKSGVVSCYGEMYFFTASGSLLELSESQPPRWSNHGRPHGGDVASIADAASVRPGVVFTVSSTGDLYEFDKNSKPSWKKHIWTEASTEEISLTPSKGFALHGSVGAKSLSLFLLTKGGLVIERRLHQRKWRWIVHGAPKGHHLSAITPTARDESNEGKMSIFLTTDTGYVFEYQLPLHLGVLQTQGNRIAEQWLNHKHPKHAKVARGIPGIQLQIGRIIFPLDDGRLAELHLSSIGGESTGPSHQPPTRRKSFHKYEWSILDAPETEGWNAEYCTDERGPANCIAGVRDVVRDADSNDVSVTAQTRRRKAQEYQNYLPLRQHGGGVTESLDENNVLTKSIPFNFRMRAMHAEKSFFFITDSGLTFEYLYTENVWLWLRHEYSTSIKGALGSYNGSLFLVDTQGNLLIRERSSNELSWTNCTAMKKGKQVATGPPWDDAPGKAQKVTAEDALFFISKKGRLLQFTVAWRKFQWKDCRNPPDTKIAYIVDHQVLRTNIVFVVGRNGRLYQYNKVAELWHEHYQSPHLILSRSPGTAMRPSPLSLIGSLFMIQDNGGLVEYQWNSVDGWNWVEHGRPHRSVALVGGPGPCLGGNQLFLIGSDGHVYRRYLDQKAWKWAGHEFPFTGNTASQFQMSSRDDETCVTEDKGMNTECGKGRKGIKMNCDEKVASIRPMPFSEESVIFELRDGRLAELRRLDEGAEWNWSRIIGTPTSRCQMDYWTAVAS